MNRRNIAVAIAVAILALVVVYVAGRLWTRGAADQFRAEMSAVAAERADEQAAEAAKLWEDSAKIEKGMTEEEVRAIMGWQHDSVSSNDGRLLWQWISRDAAVHISVLFRDGLAAEIDRERK